MPRVNCPIPIPDKISEVFPYLQDYYLFGHGQWQTPSGAAGAFFVIVAPSNKMFLLTYLQDTPVTDERAERRTGNLP